MNCSNNLYSTQKYIPAVSMYDQDLLISSLQNQPIPSNKFYYRLKQTVPSFDYCGSESVQTCSSKNFYNKLK